MKLERKSYREFMNKKRTGFIWGLSSWILDDPKAFNIVLLLGQGVGILFTAIIATFLVMFSAMPEVGYIFYAIDSVALYKYIQFVNIYRKSGYTLAGMTVREMMKKKEAKNGTR